MEMGFLLPETQTNVSPQLEWDLASSYNWSGDMWKDYWYFVANWHPLFGICFAHPAHPWKREQRLVTLVMTIAMTALLPALRAWLLHHTATSGDKEPSPEELHGPVILWLVSQWKIFTHVTIPVMLWQAALYRLSILDLYCKDRRDPCCQFLAVLVQTIRRWCFLISLVFAGMMMMTSFFMVLGRFLFVRPIATSLVQSWIAWFPIWLFLPYVGFVHSWRSEQSQGI